MADDDKAPKPRRWLMPALFVSVAVNLLIAGLVAGAFLSPDGPRHKNGENQRAIRGVLGEPFFQALPKQERAAMVMQMIGNRDEFRRGREELRTGVENFLNALRAETFDRTAAERLLNEQRRAANQRQDLGEVLLLDRLEAMSAAERSAYADALEKRLRGIRQR
ncbi:MAG: periplasmic heavy metal sensor [Pseudomonadota bacterium]